MLAMCLPGQDPHGYMGSEIAHKDYRAMLAELAAGSKDAKAQRQLGKVANLSCGYRTSAKKLLSVARVQYNLPMQLPEATHIHTTYRRTYPGVPRYWDRQIQKVRRLGYAETFAGRRVQVVGDWGGKAGWSLESTSINYPIQGCLQADVRVVTDRGCIPISELAGQKFMARTGFGWAPATAVNRGLCQLAEIELTTGDVIRCDTRHKLKTDTREWVEFKDLCYGMRVALPRLRPALAASDSVTWPYVMGCYLGDGWVSEKKRARGYSRTVGFVGGIRKLPNLVRLQEFFSLQGFQTILKRTRPTVWVLYTNRRDLFDEMVRQGVTPGLRARTKRIPEAAWRYDEQGRRDFWQGVCDTDGATTHGQVGNVHSPNLALIRDLLEYTASIGVPTRISQTKGAWLLRVLRFDGGLYPKDRLLADLNGLVPTSSLGNCQSIVDRRAVIEAQKVTQRVAERIYDRWLPHMEVYRYGEIKDIRVLDSVADTFTLSVDDALHQFEAGGVIHKNTGADQKYLALAVLKPYLVREGIHFAWELHDGLYFYVPVAKAERAQTEIKTLLDNLPYKKAWGFSPPIPLPWDCKVGSSWGQLKEVKF